MCIPAHSQLLISIRRILKIHGWCHLHYFSLPPNCSTWHKTEAQPPLRGGSRGDSCQLLPQWGGCSADPVKSLFAEAFSCSGCCFECPRSPCGGTNPSDTLEILGWAFLAVVILAALGLVGITGYFIDSFSICFLNFCSFPRSPAWLVAGGYPG